MKADSFCNSPKAAKNRYCYFFGIFFLVFFKKTLNLYRCFVLRAFEAAASKKSMLLLLLLLLGVLHFGAHTIILRFPGFFGSGAGENCVVFLVCEREESYFFLDREKHQKYSTQFWAEEKERDPTSAKVRSVLPTQNSNKVKVLQKVKLDGRFLGIRFAIFNSRHIEMIFRSFPASAPRKYAIVRTSPKLRRKVVE